IKTVHRTHMNLARLLRRDNSQPRNRGVAVLIGNSNSAFLRVDNIDSDGVEIPLLTCYGVVRRVMRGLGNCKRPLLPPPTIPVVGSPARCPKELLLQPIVQLVGKDDLGFFYVYMKRTVQSVVEAELDPQQRKVWFLTEHSKPIGPMNQTLLPIDIDP